MGYAKLARNVILFVYKHDRIQSGTTHSGSVYSASWGKTYAVPIFFSFITIGGSGHVTSTICKETIDWDWRVYGKGLGSGLMVKVWGHVLGLMVQGLELKFNLQFK